MKALRELFLLKEAAKKISVEIWDDQNGDVVESHEVPDPGRAGKLVEELLKVGLAPAEYIRVIPE